MKDDESVTLRSRLDNQATENSHGIAINHEALQSDACVVLHIDRIVAAQLWLR